MSTDTAPAALLGLLERRVELLERSRLELERTVAALAGPREPCVVWVDPIDLGDPGLCPIVVRYPDGSTIRAIRARVLGPCEVIYRPEGYPDGKHVALETWADVEIEQ